MKKHLKRPENQIKRKDSRPLKQRIKCMFWDVDGTLFEKVKSIKKEHKWLLYNAFVLCQGPKEKHNPFKVRDNAPFATLADVPPRLKEEYESLLMEKDTNPDGKYGSNGHVFMGEFGKDKCYVAKMISTIDYSQFFGKDAKLIAMIERLVHVHGIPQRILTNEVYETVVSVCNVLGLDIGLFKDPRIDQMFPPDPALMEAPLPEGIGILCGYNVHAKKPDARVFRQMLQVAGLEDEPGALMYVGDSEHKDIIPANEAGMVSALVWTPKQESSATFALPTVYGVGELFEG